MDAEIVCAVGNDVEVAIWAVPGARRTELVGRHGDALRVRLAQPPESGRANKALLELLSQTLDAKVRLLVGHKSRRKRVVVEGRSVVEVRQRLGLD